jgi:TetR/AcrR family transcriptional regulator, transcriptional repressor for nem operon
MTRPVPARDKLLAAARTLMRAKGLSATSVDEIVALAGVAKGSVYHSFRSKDELALAALEMDFSRGMEVLALGPHRAERDPVVRLAVFLEHAEAVSLDLWGRGSLLGALSVETAAGHEELQRHVGLLFRRMEQGLTPLFDAALAARGRAEPRGVELARTFVALLEGAALLGRTLAEGSRIPRAIAVFRVFILEILNKTDQSV